MPSERLTSWSALQLDKKAGFVTSSISDVFGKIGCYEVKLTEHVLLFADVVLAAGTCIVNKY